MAIFVLFEHFSGRFCLNFLSLILIRAASPNMMHFVGTFSIMRAYGARLVVIEEVRNNEKIVGLCIKNSEKRLVRAGDTYPSSHPRPVAISYKNYQKSLAYFSHLALFVLFH